MRHSMSVTHKTNIGGVHRSFARLRGNVREGEGEYQSRRQE